MDVPCFWLVEGKPLLNHIERPIAPYRAKAEADAMAERHNTIGGTAKYFVSRGSADTVWYPNLARED